MSELDEITERKRKLQAVSDSFLQRRAVGSVTLKDSEDASTITAATPANRKRSREVSTSPEASTDSSDEADK